MTDLQTDFDLFWAAYPKRKAKADARKAWLKLRPSTALVQQILDALAWQVTQPDWLKDAGTYVPLPASWLRGERWDDEPMTGLGRSDRRSDRLDGLREFIDGAVH